MFSEKLIHFYKHLKPPVNLPKGIEVLFPQKDPQVIEITEKFFRKYFHDKKPRTMMLGINPGRHGAGITGVNFTGPKQLKEYCGIEHHFKNSSELSAEFIYEMIMAYGGVKKFYRDCFIGAVCPLGFVTSPVSPEARRPLQRGIRPTPSERTKEKLSRHPSKGGDAPILNRQHEGKNINYYDDKQLMKAVTPFIINCIDQQMDMGFNRKKCLCIGGEKNFKFLSGLNDEHNWFDEIIPLPHPRFILQYRRKQKDQYIHQYLSALRFAG